MKSSTKDFGLLEKFENYVSHNVTRFPETNAVIYSSIRIWVAPFCASANYKVSRAQAAARHTWKRPLVMEVV